MDSAKVQEASTVSNSAEGIMPQQTPRGILRTSLSPSGKRNNCLPDRSPIKKYPTNPLKRTARVSFSDRSKNIPICTIYEIEPINYSDPSSPTGKSCACLIF